MNDLVVHVAAPTGRDTDLIVATLCANGVAAEPCNDLRTLLRARQGISLGPLLLTEEALSPPLLADLAEALRRQEPWSDLPVIIFTTAGRETFRSRRVSQERSILGDPVLLERPVRTETLLGTVRAALRARKKQYEVRDTLAELDRTLQELRRERTMLEGILDNLPVGIVMAGPQGEIIRGNRMAETIVRHPVLPSPDVRSYADWISFHPDGSRVEGHQYPLARAMRHGVPVLPEEFLYQRGDGSTAWVSLSAAPILDDTGHTLGVVAITDVDEQHRASQQLRNSEERFRRLIEAASVGVLIGDLTGGISYINPTLLTLLGYTREEVALGSVRWDQLTPPEFTSSDAKAIAQLEAGNSAEPYEKVYLSKDGRRIPLLVGAIRLPAVDVHSKSNVAVFLTDLSQQKKAEVALVQSEKLAAVGRLAASISHEINNPLEAITNLLYLLRGEDLSEQAQAYLQLAEGELARVSQIAGQTLRFHRQSTRARAVAPHELMEPVLALYRGRLNNSSIRVDVDATPTGSVLCFEGDIRQVLNNLVSNAIDAMRTGGTLSVRARDARSSRTGQNGVRITVADTGHGMSEATRNRIFEPFYTTKGINGTGLGLWISHGIVEKHGGHLCARSSVDAHRHGTVFSLFLPRGEAD